MADSERTWLAGEIERATGTLLESLISSRGWAANKENRILALAAAVVTFAEREANKGSDIRSILYTPAQCDRMLEQADQLGNLCSQLLSSRNTEHN